MGEIIPGHVVGMYQIEAKLGEGTMARAYIGHHLPTHSKKVLKVLRARFCNDTPTVSRFLKEGSVLKMLDHPHIVALFEEGHIEQCPYLALEYSPGVTLRELLQKRNRLYAHQAVAVAAQAAEALSYAYAQLGLTHRDLKPENILVDPEWQIKVLDFGFARYELPHYGIDSAMPGYIVGTPAYVAPEQLQGHLGSDGRSDVYALGVCLFEMLTGRLPFQARTLDELLYLHTHSEPVPLGHIPAIIQLLRGHSRLVDPHPQLEAVVAKALAVDPAERWESMGDFAIALRGLQKRA